MTIQENDHSLRIEGIPDIMTVRDELKKRGSFDPSFSLYTIKTPLGEIVFRTDWWHSSGCVGKEKAVARSRSPDF